MAERCGEPELARGRDPLGQGIRWVQSSLEGAPEDTALKVYVLLRHHPLAPGARCVYIPGFDERLESLRSDPNRVQDAEVREHSSRAQLVDRRVADAQPLRDFVDREQLTSASRDT